MAYTSGNFPHRPRKGVPKTCPTAAHYSRSVSSMQCKNTLAHNSSRRALGFLFLLSAESQNRGGNTEQPHRLIPLLIKAIAEGCCQHGRPPTAMQHAVLDTYPNTPCRKLTPRTTSGMSIGPSFTTSQLPCENVERSTYGMFCILARSRIATVHKQVTEARLSRR